jgi:uncharacterized protein YcgL (UPF0745 family)
VKISIHRRGVRALFVAHTHPLENIPPAMLAWLGPPERVESCDFDPHTPLTGLSATEVWSALQRDGYCAVDECRILAEARHRHPVSAPQPWD